MIDNNAHNFLNKIKNTMSLEDDDSILIIERDEDNIHQYQFDNNLENKYQSGQQELIKGMEIMMENYINKFLSKNLDQIIDKYMEEKLQKHQLKGLIREAIQDFFK